MIDNDSNGRMSFTHQKEKLRSPADITIEDITLDKFLKIYDGVVEEVLSSGFENVESAIMKIDLVLGEKGLGITFLKEEDLSNVDFRKANLRFINLKEAILDGADFSGAEMKYANIKEASLKGAKFVGTEMENCNIKEANLTKANFKNANLEGSNLKEASLYGVNFSGTDLSETDIHEAEGLTVEQLLKAKSLDQTHLPEKIQLIISSKKGKR